MELHEPDRKIEKARMERRKLRSLLIPEIFRSPLNEDKTRAMLLIDNVRIENSKQNRKMVELNIYSAEQDDSHRYWIQYYTHIEQ